MATRKSNKQNNNFARASHFLYISFPSTAQLPVKMPNFMFCEGRKQAMTKFINFIDLDMLIEIQLQKSSLAFDKVSVLEKSRYKLKKCEFRFPCDLFVIVSRRGIF